MRQALGVAYRSSTVGTLAANRRKHAAKPINLVQEIGVRGSDQRLELILHGHSLVCRSTFLSHLNLFIDA
ncbi:MAG: hypothetical protein R3D30_14440 [Hyphomicrobiales bacterium]